jgi:tetratricopeptide (TPR) repeat protein
VRTIAAVLAVAALTFPPPARAFRQAPVGTPIRDRTLPTIDGKRAPLLAPGKVSVFVFVRPAQEHTVSALRQLAVLERELERKPVRFVAVVSDGEVPSEVQRLAREVGLRMPVLVDPGDALYGELGVAMYPSAGIVGRDGRLAAFQPFRKVNYLDAMRGRVQVALGELDEAGLAAILDPGVPVQTGGGRAHARLKLARALLGAGMVEKAIESARAAVALDPSLADGHQLLSEALAKAGRCEEAEREAALARRLAPAAVSPALACLRH